MLVQIVIKRDQRNRTHEQVNQQHRPQCSPIDPLAYHVDSLLAFL